ncbi:DUF1707 domain-containing protein [Epidermidibacterium keratini]|uniref:DUF1707 domain-containing protein n=1 Tax=Epidermidibacterium keratini TaxID=1891644 RepID=A0A7L4YMD1_9ACTN|nr:DUF1707 domain-containing protein [Epidermidibacterium keratini]QHC00441.1 DUF1707 domain-containing protein [Epidermidibacterium keratini]
MTEGDVPAVRASDQDRERVAQVLHRAASDGRITMDELEERLDVVYAAKTRDELTAPVSDLPSDVGAAGRETERRVAGSPGSTSSIAVMSGTERRGAWVVPAKHTSLAFWGGVTIDLRQARFAGPESAITAVAIMGGIDVLVPDDVDVDVTGTALMGAFETQEREGAAAHAPPGAPRVRVSGFAFWGAVNVIRVPAERESRREIDGA